MNIGIVSTYEIFNKENAIFNFEKYPIGDNLEYQFVYLKEKLKEKNIEINTLDMYKKEKVHKIIFFDFPNQKIDLQKLYKKGIELYLVILESEIIKKENFDKKNHKFFTKIFTWKDSFIDDKKYFKLNLANKIPKHFKIDLSKKEKFCTNISSNKKNKDNRELYSERIKGIEWFNKNYPDKFDLYGLGWGEYYFQRPLSRLNKFKKLRKIFGKKYSVYKGTVEIKRNILEKYKFSLCYENAKDIEGYVTEKIFDCLFAGVIPIYLGPKEISNIIPEEVFINKRNYKTYYELYTYLNNMSDKTYLNYIKKIEEYVNSKKIYPFSAENFSEILIREIIE